MAFDYHALFLGVRNGYRIEGEATPPMKEEGLMAVRKVRNVLRFAGDSPGDLFM
jgi:hypothetical protein